MLLQRIPCYEIMKFPLFGRWYEDNKNWQISCKLEGKILNDLFTIQTKIIWFIFGHDWHYFLSISVRVKYMHITTKLELKWRWRQNCKWSANYYYFMPSPGHENSFDTLNNIWTPMVPKIAFFFTGTDKYNYEYKIMLWSQTMDNTYDVSSVIAND